MNLEDILKEWDDDSTVDHTKLESESLRITKLHSKYLIEYVDAKLRVRKLKEDYALLRRQKHVYYTQGPSKSSPPEWLEEWPGSTPLKTDLHVFMDGDKVVSEAKLKLGYQEEKVEALKLILDAIRETRWSIKTAVEERKRKDGIG